MGLMKMMLMPFRMLRYMSILWRLMIMALGLIKIVLTPLRMMKHMRMMGRPTGMKHMHRHSHMMWRSTMMMFTLAQLAMLLLIVVVIIASTVLPVLVFVAFLMKKRMKKHMCFGTHCRNMRWRKR
ncbi:MAG: hypothetical protein ACXVIF_03230 [Halobacteriota archaeon]